MGMGHQPPPPPHVPLEGSRAVAVSLNYSVLYCFVYNEDKIILEAYVFFSYELLPLPSKVKKNINFGVNIF